MSKKNNNGGFGILEILIGIGVAIALFYLFLLITR